MIWARFISDAYNEYMNRLKLKWNENFFFETNEGAGRRLFFTTKFLFSDASKFIRYPGRDHLFFLKKKGRRLFLIKSLKIQDFIFQKSHFWRSKSYLYWAKWLECVHWRMIHTINTYRLVFMTFMTVFGRMKKGGYSPDLIVGGGGLISGFSIFCLAFQFIITPPQFRKFEKLFWKFLKCFSCFPICMFTPRRSVDPSKNGKFFLFDRINNEYNHHTAGPCKHRKILLRRYYSKLWPYGSSEHIAYQSQFYCC